MRVLTHVVCSGVFSTSAYSSLGGSLPGEARLAIPRRWDAERSADALNVDIPSISPCNVGTQLSRILPGMISAFMQ